MAELSVLCPMCYPEPFGGKVWRNGTLPTDVSTRLEKKRSGICSALLQYRLRRYARLSRWMMGDEDASSSMEASCTINRVPLTTLIFFSTFSSISGLQNLESVLGEIAHRNEFEADLIKKFERILLRKYRKAFKSQEIKKGKKPINDEGSIMNLSKITPLLSIDKNLLVGRWKCFDCGMFNLIDTHLCFFCNICQYEDESDDEDDDEDRHGDMVRTENGGRNETDSVRESESESEWEWEWEEGPNAEDMDEESPIEDENQDRENHDHENQIECNEDGNTHQDEEYREICEAMKLRKKKESRARKRTLELILLSSKGTCHTLSYLILYSLNSSQLS